MTKSLLSLKNEITLKICVRTCRLDNMFTGQLTTLLECIFWDMNSSLLEHPVKDVSSPDLWEVSFTINITYP
jgi:hypothetical protein